MAARPVSSPPIILASTGAQGQEEEDKDKVASIQEIRNRAILEPMDNVRFWLRAGTALTVVARPRNAISLILTQFLHEKWESFSTSETGSRIVQKMDDALRPLRLFSYDYLRLIYILFTENIDVFYEDLATFHDRVAQRDYFKYTAKEASTLTTPGPKTLVKVRQGIEKLNRIRPISWISQTGGWLISNAAFRTISLGINRGYQRVFHKQEPLFQTETFPPSVAHLLFGNAPGEYVPFANRADRCLIDALPITQEMLDIPQSPQTRDWLQTLDFFGKLKQLMRQDANRVFQNVAFKTLQNTAKERVALIEAVEGMVLRMVYDTAVKQIPSAKSILINQMVAQLLLPLDWAAAGLAGYLPYPLSEINKIPDFAQLGSKFAGTLADTLVAPFRWCAQGVENRFGDGVDAVLNVSQLLLHFSAEKLVGLCGKPFVLKYAPLTYGIVFHERERWAAEGRSRLKQFSTLTGLKDLAAGTKPEVKSDELQEILDSNMGYLLPICAEFTLGAIGRMCEDERLGDAKGALRLIQLGMRSIILGETIEASLAGAPAPSETVQRRPEIPGMVEAKLAFKELMQKMKQVFLAEFKGEIARELERQQLSAKKAFSETLEIQQDIYRAEAGAVAKVASFVVSEEKAQKVGSVVHTVLDAPNALARVVGNGLYAMYSYATSSSKPQPKVKED